MLLFVIPLYFNLKNDQKKFDPNKFRRNLSRQDHSNESRTNSYEYNRIYSKKIYSVINRVLYCENRKQLERTGWLAPEINFWIVLCVGKTNWNSILMTISSSWTIFLPLNPMLHHLNQNENKQFFLRITIMKLHKLNGIILLGFKKWKENSYYI